METMNIEIVDSVNNHLNDEERMLMIQERLPESGVQCAYVTEDE